MRCGYDDSDTVLPDGFEASRLNITIDLQVRSPVDRKVCWTIKCVFEMKKLPRGIRHAFCIDTEVQ